MAAAAAAGVVGAPDNRSVAGSPAGAAGSLPADAGSPAGAAGSSLVESGKTWAAGSPAGAVGSSLVESGRMWAVQPLSS